MKTKRVSSSVSKENGVGKRIIVCMGSSCFARGNDVNLETIQRFLAERQLVAEVELIGCRCEGQCAEGPVVTMEGQRYGQLAPERMRAVLQAHFGGEGDRS